MSEQILEQVSAFLDGELPNAETELLLKRLIRDGQLRESFGRYALFGECLRGGAHAGLSKGFAGRVNRAIDGEPASAHPLPRYGRQAAWWRPLAGATIAAGVAVVAVATFQQRAIAPALRLPATAQTVGQPSATASGLRLVRNAPDGGVAAANGSGAAPREAISYTVPATVPDAPAALPAARLTNYVFAHSRYSSVMGQNDVLNDLLSAADTESGSGVPAAGVPAAGAPGAGQPSADGSADGSQEKRAAP